MLMRFLLTALMAVTLAACSSSDNSSSSGGGIDPKGTDIPDTPGNFKYSFTKNDYCSGYCDDFRKRENCETTKTFKSRRPYCQGLRDMGLNNACALNERRALYLKDCGPNFEEINMGGLNGGSSRDNHTNATCSYNTPNPPNFAAYCAMLKDEETIGYCHWDYRRELFKQHACPGSFSDLPPEYAEKDDGTMNVSWGYRYNETSNATYKRRTATFKLEPTTPKILKFEEVSIDASTCERKGLVTLRGILKDLNNNTQAEFNPRMDSLALSANIRYVAVVEILNPGMCKRVSVSYKVSPD